MLEDLPIQVRHIRRTAQVVRVVVVLVLFEDFRRARRVAVAVSVASGVAVANPVGVAVSAAVAVGPAPGWGAAVGQVVGQPVAIDVDHVGGLDQLRDQTRAAGKHVLGADSAARSVA